MTKYYDISNNLDTLEYRLESFMNVLEALAASDQDDLSSGTMWFIHDTVKTYKEEVGRISAEAMMAHRDQSELGYRKDANGKKK
jgi:hypothetical protein